MDGRPWRRNAGIVLSPLDIQTVEIIAFFHYIGYPYPAYMNLTHEEIQKARRISRAIQEYLLSTGQKDARTPDIYSFLVRRGLIKADRHNGLFLRRFLNKLKHAGMLKLIPQCAHSLSASGQNEWHFYLASEDRAELSDIRTTGEDSQKHYAPKLSQDEIDQLIAKEAPLIDSLPKRTNAKFTSQELEIRKNYPRAYDPWTATEIDLMKRVFKQSNNIDAVATLLKRQPHIVKERLKS
ncbi:hypothetical protein [Chitinophaga cymbidii]|uniref:Uncharacterized protein n=1 Tax=Chitinophaga cymbidii TaxID=1096750 RepID=A0A512RJD5_9BACT|nr:hypothetical protein [Chitinophaga cymbidii]GEP95821.1 hypothetical protein CCY01nite_20810 [Chitinophaga cymbidii]